jgi:streptogramin lyase
VRPRDAAIEASGTLVVADEEAGPGQQGEVIRVDPATGTQTVVSSGGNFADPSGIAVAANGDLYVADISALGAGAIFKVNPVSGAQTTVSSNNNLATPSGIVLAANGDIYIADQDALGGSGAIILVNPTNGNQTIVSHGNGFADPTWLTFVPDGSLLVTDENYATGRGVIRVDPTTGNQTGLSQSGFSDRVSGIALQDTGHAVVADAGHGGGQRSSAWTSVLAPPASFPKTSCSRRRMDSLSCRRAVTGSCRAVSSAMRARRTARWHRAAREPAPSGAAARRVPVAPAMGPGRA